MKLPFNLNSLFLIILSLIIVAYAQPDWSVVSCVGASAIGYALFWRGVLSFKNKKRVFWAASLWFFLVSATHLSWFFSDRYVGFYIYPFFLALCLVLGLQFGMMTLLIPDPKKMTLFHILGLCGGWTLFEWVRLLPLSGFSWDPIGLSLSASTVGMQMASLLGVYGLSFWVIFTNLLALRLSYQKSVRGLCLWLIIATLPYLFGSIQVAVHKEAMEKETSQLNALLVQTALMPELKQSINGSTPLSPLAQWEKILDLLQPFYTKNIDLIVLPEAAVPYGTYYPIYHESALHALFNKTFGGEANVYPPIQPKVGNLFLAQTLSRVFEAPIVIGLEDVERAPQEHSATAYNAAFMVRPHTLESLRYEKRVLVPMGEFIPFEWCKKILSKYGILDSFTPGREAKIFTINKTHLGVSICYEETYGHLMLENRKKGAELLVNLTNDVWYPRSRLPMAHFLHGRLRAVEGGVPLLRACNTGVTCAVNALGEIVGSLPFDCANEACQPGVLSVSLPLYHYATFYSFFGDGVIIFISSILFTCLCISKFIKRKQFILNSLEIYLLRKN